MAPTAVMATAGNVGNYVFDGSVVSGDDGEGIKGEERR